ncbi:MAG: ZmpA/ZmpB/ZmpC family metallo-endopeptidase-related protein, partial [Firmicutes bacterium]|nr:ZmpA/ZmpB/ZmpC family metallo-endopeptidase-related protein [Bacillota bacterium]
MKNRKYLAACLVAGLAVSMTAGQVGFAAESIGSGIVQQEVLNPGTESEKESEAESEVQQDSNVPEGYQGIYQVSDLSRLSEKPDGKYILMNDLDLASAEWQGSIPVFRGTLDGGNHQIKGLKTALIQVLEEGTICNLSLVDVEISHSGDTGALADTIGTGKKASVRIQNV